MSEAPVAVVTGACGFLGRHLLRELLARGRRVLALCRDAACLGELRHRRLEVRALELDDAASLRRVLGGTTVFHLAAVRNQPRNGPEAMRRVNVEGTLGLAEAALEAGARRLVHVSTLAGPRHLAYFRSKADAVDGLRSLAARGLDTVVAAPTIVFGPDHRSHPNRITGHMRRLLRWRTSVRIGDGRAPRNLVYVQDVVEGLLLAEAHGVPGDELVLAGADAAPAEFDELVLRLAGQRLRLRIGLPRRAAHGAACVLDRLGGRSRDAGYRGAVELLALARGADRAAVREPAGYRPLSLQDGLVRTLQFLRYGARA